MTSAKASTLSVALALLAAAAVAQEIQSFESEAFANVKPAGCVGERVREHASDGEWALKVAFPGSAGDTWPGVFVELPNGAITKKHVLSFDVYNPHDEPVYLSYRIDTDDGQKVFGSQTLFANKPTLTQISFLDAANSLDLARVVRVFPYIRMPREDYVLYFDNFRLETYMAKFTRLAYLETAPLPEPSADEARLGGYVFRRGELAHVFSNSAPWPGERIESLAVFAAQGETEPLGLSVRTLRPVDCLELSIEPMASDHGALPETAIELGLIRHLDKKTSYSSKEYMADVPVYVEEGHVFEGLDAGVAQSFWIRFRVPADAVPGAYRGAAVLASSGGEMRIPLTLTVLPFQLPEVRHTFIGEYYRPTNYESDEEWKQGVTADLADMRDHGMTSLGLCAGLDTTRVKIDGDSVDLGLDGTTRFEHLMDTYVALGFPMPIVMLADSGQGAAAAVGAYGTPEFDRAYQAFWRAVQAVGKERGWPELIVQPVDEPGWKEQEAKDKNVHLLKLLKEIPGMRTEQDGPGDGYFIHDAGPVSDMWNYNGGIADFDAIREIRETHLVAFYNNDVESYRPEVDRFVCGFYQKAAGIDGVFNWEYRGGRGSLYDDMDGPSGDWVHNYPPSEESTGGPSVAWEAAREGVDDLRYVLLLEDWIQRAQANPEARDAVREAEAMLVALLESLDATPRVRGRACWSQSFSRAEVDARGGETDPEAKGFFGGYLKHPNGWTLDDYQEARWQIAEAIVGLMAACGEAVEIPKALADAPAFRLEGYSVLPSVAAKAATAGAGEPVALIPKLSAAPSLDGRLDDAAWAEAYRVERFVPHVVGGTVTAQAEAYVGWFGTDLYVAVRCEEPYTQNLVAACMEDGEPTWNDDCIEIFLDPGVSRAQFAQLVFNSKGVQWSQTVRGEAWKDRLPVRAAVGADEWTLEIAVPLSEVLKGSADFGLNLCRERKASQDPELSCWQQTGSQFGNPSVFAHVRLADAEGIEGITQYESPETSLIEIESADALVSANGRLAVEAAWVGLPDALEEATWRFALRGEAGEIGTETIGPPAPAHLRAVFTLADSAPGVCELVVTVTDKSGTPKSQAVHRVAVAPALPR
ncbi:MAG TPA: sugar-binding protein [Candidatus Hydrogenedentes bacterium]|nr:sugar-binding protein [Candidatus Hydrogenedentota bacterium]HPG68881.1 sugar-binding protein [Candidatus Hydrogenedentota bacterium]